MFMIKELTSGVFWPHTKLTHNSILPSLPKKYDTAVTESSCDKILYLHSEHDTCKTYWIHYPWFSDWASIILTDLALGLVEQ